MRTLAGNTLAIVAVSSVALAVSLPLGATAAMSPRSVTFAVADVTAGFTTWTVPAGVTSITIAATGADGGAGLTSPGGRGNTVTAEVAVVPGEVLTVAVGSAGQYQTAGVPGGGSTQAFFDGGGGGGWSGVQLADLTPLVVGGAGGGGSGHASIPGGDAGQPGANGFFLIFGFGGGGGAGTDTAGGAGGTAGPGGAVGSAGSQYQGGAAPYNAGAGGAGYYGGGSGGVYYTAGGGGGGSSFPTSAAPGFISSALKAPGAPVDGSVTISWEVETFEVSFDSAGGSAVPVQVVDTGSFATAPADPTRPGYEFTGWFTAPAGGTVWDFGSAVAADQVAYARWASVLPATGTDPAGLALVGGAILLLGGAAQLFALRRRSRSAD